MPRTRRWPRPLVAVAAVAAAVMLTVAACDSSPADPGADGDWILVSGHGPDGPIDVVQDHEPTLSVNGYEVSGHAGCNQFGTATEDDGEQPQEWPTEFISTMMACDPPEVMEQETVFLGAMRQVEDVHASGAELVLSGADTELRFEPAST